MNAIKAIRARLGLTQTALAAELGCTQGNVGHYENKGQRVLPEVALRLIDVAAARGLHLTMGQVYAVEPLPRPAISEPNTPPAPDHQAQAATDSVAERQAA